MEQKEVSAVAKNEGVEVGSATVLVNYPTTVEEALSSGITEEALLSNAFANWRVTLQSAIRTRLKAGKTQEDIQTEMADAKMGVTMSGGTKVDPQAAFLAKFKNADPEEQAELLKMLKQAAK